MTGKQTEKPAWLQATVKSVDQPAQTVDVSLDSGRLLRLRLQSDNTLWNYLTPGAQVEIARDQNTAQLRRPQAPKTQVAPAAAASPPSPPFVPGPAPTSRKTPQPATLTQQDQARSAPDSLERSEPRWREPQPFLDASPAGELENDLDRPIECPDVTAAFALGGPVAALLGPRYRPRDGQIRMANLVRHALVEKRHAVLEAGTGVGKSFAYLVPVVWSGTKAVVSTSNKALMSQLWHKDLPDLRRIAPRPFTYALLKGRTNYLCKLKLDEFLKQGRLPGLDHDIRRVASGLGDVPSGDCEEMNLSRDLQQRLTVSHRECGGPKCDKFRDCFYELAKVEAARADIVVTNHALLCFNTLRNENKILPVRPVLIVDEAHELQRYAINALTQTLEYETLGSYVNHPLTRDATPADFRREAQERNGVFFDTVLGQRPDKSSERWALHGEIQEGLALWNVLQRIQLKLKAQPPNKDDQGSHDALLRFGDEILDTVDVLARPEQATYIRYCDLTTDRKKELAAALKVQYEPLEVADDLERVLFKAWPRVISTSATLSVEDDLTWYERRVGLTNASNTLRDSIQSPFNYQEQVLLYTPRGLEPAYNENQAQYFNRLAGEVHRLVTASRGRAFVLCTSRKSMQQLFERLSPLLEYPSYCQDQGVSRQELLEMFKASGEAVLFATRSFWEGVDVPGDALSLVILDKIPFIPPSDPVFKRQELLVEERGGDPFDELQLANAILTLRQGAGRLIRSETDRGVIAILDSRINTKKYGPRIVASLPRARRSMQFDAVQQFFAGQ